MNNIRIAAVSCRAVVGKIEENLARSAHWSRQAKKAGAELVCFPELNISGYCLDPVMTAMAQTIPGPITDILSGLAHDTQLTILAGMVEQNPHGLPYVSHCVFQPHGEISVYRKLHLSPHELPIFEKGRQVSLFQACGLNFGIQLCYDGHFPELAAAMTAAGADIIFLPHASPRGDARSKHRSWMRHLPARAYDNSIYVAACNQWGDNQKGLAFPGNALILDPSGNIMEKSVSGKETMLIADLTRETLSHVRNHPMRYFFPNRRPELYK